MQRFKWIIAIVIVIIIGGYITSTRELKVVSQEVDFSEETPIMKVMSERLDKGSFVSPYTTYTVDLSIDEKQKSFEGITQILYTHNYERVTDKIIMNTNHIKTKSVKINLAPVPFEQKESNLVVHTPFPIKENEELTITIEFEGTLNNEKQHSTKGIYLCNFIPKVLTYDEYSGWVRTSSIDIDTFRLIKPANYHVTVHTYKGQYPIGTGSISGIIEQDDIITTTFDANRVRGFGLFLGDEMEREIYNAEEGYSIVLYYMERTSAVDELLTSLKSSLKAYGDTFGTYPYDQLTIIHKEGLDNGSYPTLLMGDFSEKESLQKDINKLVGEQWLYYIIGNINEKECWLSKGLLEYLNKRFLFSSREMITYIKEIDDEELVVKMFYEIEEAIGADKFIEALRVYYKNYSFQMASGEEFIQTMEDVSNTKVMGIYKFWFNQIGPKESGGNGSSVSSSW